METASKQQVINAALDHVFGAVTLLVQAFAMRFALENWGQRLVHHLPPRCTPDRVYSACWNSLYQGSESDDMAAGLEDERAHWAKEGERVVAMVQAKGLPLTMRNAENAWYEREDFAKSQ